MKKNKNKNAHSERILHHYAQDLDQGQKIGDSGGSGVTFFLVKISQGGKVLYLGIFGGKSALIFNLLTLKT